MFGGDPDIPLVRGREGLTTPFWVASEEEMTGTLMGEAGSGGITLTIFTGHRTLGVRGQSMSEVTVGSLGSAGGGLCQQQCLSQGEPLLEEDKELVSQ